MLCLKVKIRSVVLLLFCQFKSDEDNEGPSLQCEWGGGVEYSDFSSGYYGDNCNATEFMEI